MTAEIFKPENGLVLLSGLTEKKSYFYLNVRFTVDFITANKHSGIDIEIIGCTKFFKVFDPGTDLTSMYMFCLGYTQGFYRPERQNKTKI